MPPGEKKRILFVSPFDEPVSGADESLLLAVRHLDRGRFDGHVLLPPGSHYLERYRAEGAVTHVRRLSRMRRNFSPAFWAAYFRDLRRDLRELPGFLREFKIDLVHLNMHVALGPALAARRAGLPVVTHYRAKTNDSPGLFFDLFLPWLHRRSDAVVCISEATAEHFRRRRLNERVHVIPNPVELERFSVPRVPHPGSNILFVGRIDPQKRLHVLLEALGILAGRRPDVRLTVMGEAAEIDRTYADRLRARVKKEGLPVTWVEGRKDAEAFLAEADVLAFPAVNEGFGRVLVEALAAGVPIVAARSGASPEILGGGERGQLVEPDDAAALADALERAWTEETWKNISERGKAFAGENFSVAAHVRRLVEVYERLLHTR